jgi:hypothetical protein
MLLKLQNSKVLFVIIGLVGLSFFYLTPIFPDEITTQFLISGQSNSTTRNWLIWACVSPAYRLDHLTGMYFKLNQLLFAPINSLVSLRIYSFALALPVFFFFYSNYKKLNTIELHLLVPVLFHPIIFINAFVYFRPEKLILLLVITSCYLLGSISRNRPVSYVAPILYSALFVLCFLNHPKVAYFVPMFLYVLYKIARSGNLPIAFWTCWLLFLTYSLFMVLRLNISTWPCPGVEEIRLINAGHAVNPLTIFHDFGDFVRGILTANDDVRTVRAASQIMFRRDYDIGYLPNMHAAFVSTALNIVGIIIVICIIFYSIFKSVGKLLAGPNRNLFGFLLMFTNLGVYILNGNKGPYDVVSFIIICVIYIFYSADAESQTHGK